MSLTTQPQLPRSAYPKILDVHLKRLAVIYVRQSSPYQVENHLESQKRQYQLTERAEQLGWPQTRCQVIDEDLGISGAQSFNRPGNPRLVSMIALREVGLVLGLEVSRLARNSLDWYQLLELAAAFDVLIADEDGVYNPSDCNDRLLLGVKGTISEVELYQIKARMWRGRRNCAQRGDLLWNMPIGLEYDTLSGQIRLATDQSVRHAIALVLDLFKKRGSVRGVLNYLAREGVELPSQRLVRGVGRMLSWQKPRYHVIYQIVTNPMYAGIYAYGRRQQQIDPLAQTRHVVRRERESGGKSFYQSIMRATSRWRNTRPTWQRLRTTTTSFQLIKGLCVKDRLCCRAWSGASTVARRCAYAIMMDSLTTPVMLPIASSA